MADLVEKFFAQDLTEAEERALGEALMASDEQALKFGRLAEEAYARYGLPDPGAGPSTTGGLTGGPSLTTWCLLGLIAAGFLLYWIKGSPSEECVSTPVPVLSDADRPVQAGSVRKAAPPVSASPVPSYDLLKILVEQDATGPVVVRVLSPEGREVRRMYDGTLAAGHWAFRWDGKLADGMLARPGIYAIEIDNGRAVQSKKVLVQ